LPKPLNSSSAPLLVILIFNTGPTIVERHFRHPKVGIIIFGKRVVFAQVTIAGWLALHVEQPSPFIIVHVQKGNEGANNV